MEHLGAGRGRNFTGGQRGEEQTQGAVVTGCHGAPQFTQWLKVAGGHAVILVARGGDGWMAHRQEFGRRRPVVSQQRKGTGLGGNRRGSRSGV
jgi:hypothetical protein